MEDVIDDLKIEIVGDSYTAEKSIDKVISLLKEIDSVTSRINKSISEPLKPIEALQKTIDSIKSVDKLREIGEAIASLNGIKVSKTIAKEITNIGVAVRSIQDLDTGKLNDISNAVSNISAARMPKVETQNTIPATASNVSDISQESVNFDGITESAEITATTMAGVSAQADQTGEAINNKVASCSERIADFNAKFSNIEKPLKSITKKISNLFTMVRKRIMYRALNAVISAITGGFKEGVQNIYAYSQMMGTSFAKNMDSLATSYLYLKNSIGAAAAPIITMLIPFVEKAIDKFVELLNAINMVFSLLSGSNKWTRAVKYPTTFTNGMSKATKAAKELKKTLLSIDEIHKLNDNSTSAAANGVSNTAAKYQFVTDDLDIQRADELKRKFVEILGIVGSIRLAILGWDIGKLFGGIAGGLAGAGLGAGAGLLATGLIDAFTTELDSKSGLLIAGGATLITTVIGGLLGGPMGAGIGALVGVIIGGLGDFAIWLYQHWDTVKARASDWWNGSIVPIFTQLGEELKNTKEHIRDFFDRAKEWFGEAGSRIKDWWNDSILSIFKQCGKEFDELPNKISSFMQRAKNKLDGIGSYFDNLWKTVAGKFTKLGSTVGNAFANAFKSAVNSVINFVENNINGLIRAINRAINLINNIPGVNISPISTLSIPRMASGGQLSSGQLFVAREAGPELVGTMGGRSTVVNNQQIVDGVANGVYRGVRDAMAESDGGTPIIVQVVDRAGNVIEEIKAANLRAGRTLIPVDA